MYVWRFFWEKSGEVRQKDPAKLPLWDIDMKSERGRPGGGRPDGLGTIEWFAKTVPKDFHGPWSARPHFVKNFQDAMYWDLAEHSSIQGRLQRRIERANREVWRDGWFLLTGNTLWQFSLTVADGADLSLPPSVHDLALTKENALSFVDSTSFSITFSILGEVVKETFRARSAVEAKRWMVTLAGHYHRRVSAISPHLHANGAAAADDYRDNDTLLQLEHSMCESERRLGQLRLLAAEAYYDFWGALRHPLLRDRFRDYLRQRRRHSLLSFWEYAEDFRRGHPASPQPYRRSELISSVGSERSWAADLRAAFLLPSAPSALPLSLGSSHNHSLQDDACAWDSFLPLQQAVQTQLRDIFAEDFAPSAVYRHACMALQLAAARSITTEEVRTPTVAAKTSSVEKPRPRSLFGLLSRANGPKAEGADGVRASTQLGSASQQPAMQSRELQAIRTTLSTQQTGMPAWWWASATEVAQGVKDGVPVDWLACTTEEALAIKAREAGGTSSAAQVDCEEVDEASPMTAVFQQHLLAVRQRLMLGLEPGAFVLSSVGGQQVGGLGAVHLVSAMTVHCLRPPRRVPAAGTSARATQTSLASAVASVRIDSALLVAQLDEADTAPTVDSDDPLAPTSAAKALAAASIDLFSTGYVRLLAVACTSSGVPSVFLLDPLTSRPLAVFRLHEVLRIGPADKLLQALELLDEDGCCWQLSPDGMDEADAAALRMRWLSTLWSMVACSPASVNRAPAVAYTVVKRGVLLKKGQVNTSFKPRFFELSSDLKLRYFKCDGAGTYKGQIDLILLDRFTSTVKKDDVSRFELLICLSMQRANRIWILKALSEVEAEDWVAAMNDLLLVWEHKGRPYSANTATIDTADAPDSSDEEDSERDNGDDG